MVGGTAHILVRPQQRIKFVTRLKGV